MRPCQEIGPRRSIFPRKMREDGERCRHAIFSPSLLESRERVVGRHLLTCPPHTLGLAQCSRTKKEKDGFISLFLQKKKRHQCQGQLVWTSICSSRRETLEGLILFSSFSTATQSSDPRFPFFHLARSFFSPIMNPSS